VISRIGVLLTNSQVVFLSSTFILSCKKKYKRKEPLETDSEWSWWQVVAGGGRWWQVMRGPLWVGGRRQRTFQSPKDASCLSLVIRKEEIKSNPKDHSERKRSSSLIEGIGLCLNSRLDVLQDEVGGILGEAGNFLRGPHNLVTLQTIHHNAAHDASWNSSTVATVGIKDWVRNRCKRSNDSKSKKANNEEKASDSISMFFTPMEWRWAMNLDLCSSVKSQK